MKAANKIMARVLSIWCGWRVAAHCCPIAPREKPSTAPPLLCIPAFHHPPKPASSIPAVHHGTGRANGESQKPVLYLSALPCLVLHLPHAATFGLACRTGICGARLRAGGRGYLYI